MQKYLLDTHTLLWMQDDSTSLFDRIIVSTAIELDLQVITLDPNIIKYDLVSVW